MEVITYFYSMTKLICLSHATQVSSLVHTVSKTSVCVLLVIDSRRLTFKCSCSWWQLIFRENSKWEECSVLPLQHLFTFFIRSLPRPSWFGLWSYVMTSAFCLQVMIRICVYMLCVNVQINEGICYSEAHDLLTYPGITALYFNMSRYISYNVILLAKATSVRQIL